VPKKLFGAREVTPNGTRTGSQEDEALRPMGGRCAALGFLLTSLSIPFGAAAAPSPADAEPATWVLQRYGERGRLMPVLPGTEITLVIDRRQGRLGGSGGCNSYTAGFQVKGNRLAVTPIAATKKFCGQPEGSMLQENRYFETLQAVERYRLKDRKLKLFAAGGQVLVFRRR
jgi:heat shock protein HslJ